jgi:hypothetical protein
MKNHARAFVLVLSAVALAGCGDATGPFPGVLLQVEATPASISSGDTLWLRGIIQNTTTERVVFSGCGLPVRFELRRLLDPPLPLAGAAGRCVIRDYHRLEPLETDTITIPWAEHRSRGIWQVRMGFPHGDGLSQTVAAEFVVN